MGGFLKVLGVIFLIVLGLGAGAAFLGYQFLNQAASTSSETTVFEVKPGETFKQVARRLEEQGLVKSASMLHLYARLTGGGKVRVGEYVIRRDSKPRDILNVLSSGRSLEYSITVQEGFNLFEIAMLVEAKGFAKKDEFIQLARNKALIKELLGEDLSSLEGYLFPETYHITKFTGAKGLIRMMVQRFKENYAKVPVDPSLELTRHQIVTLASIIEKETGAPEERPVISSVFHNRLRMNMRLQTDPTVVYGIWDKTGAWNRNISREDLVTPNRYNTYLNSGLPYGPISNPGFEALKAAVAPAETEFLFFVSRNDGTHIFSKDYGQHQRAVTQYQLDAKAREGKSWRDLQKRESVPGSILSATPAPKPGLKAAPTATPRAKGAKR